MRVKDYTDSLLPNANAVSAFNLLELYHLTFNEVYKEKGDIIFRIPGTIVENSPLGHTDLLAALDFATDDVKEITVMSGKDVTDHSGVMKLLNQPFAPNKVVVLVAPSAGAPKTESSGLFGKTDLVYLCRNGFCLDPTADTKKIKKYLGEVKSYTLDNVPAQDAPKPTRKKK
jgi:uncharacterized protein YyaL (SSP411 family)